MKRCVLVILGLWLAGAVFADDSRASRARGREMDSVSEEVDHALSVTLPADVKFRPERGAKKFIITLPAGRYGAFAKDAGGTFFLFDGPGLGIPGNFGIAKKGGVYFPDDAKRPIGAWLLPPHYSAKSGVIYLSDLPPEASDVVRSAKK